MEQNAGNRSKLFSFHGVIQVAKFTRIFKTCSDMQISAQKLRELIRRKKGHYNFEEEKPVHGYEYEVGSEKIAADSGLYGQVLLG